MSVRKVRHGLALIEPIYIERQANVTEGVRGEVVQECSPDCPGYDAGVCKYFGSTVGIPGHRGRLQMCKDAEVFHEMLLDSSKHLSQIVELMHQ